VPITPERLSRLREFGLSEYAARAYLALLDLGVAEARDVSTLSKVPQAKIYHVLEQLHEKGLAVILPEFPKKYAPVPFPEYLDRLHDEHDRQAQAIDRDREVLAEMFRVVGDADVGNLGFFTVVRGRRNVLAKIAEMLNEAKSDLLVLGTTGLASRYPSLQNELEDARRRGLRLRILLPLTAETIPRLEALDAIAELRGREADEGSQSGRVAIVLVDGARAFLINFLPDDDNLYAGKDIGVFTDQEAIVAALQTLVEPRWQDAPTPEEAREADRSGQIRPRDVGLGVLFDEMHDSVFVCDENGRILLWNPAASLAFGRSPQDAIDLNVASLFPDHAAPFLDAARGQRADLVHVTGVSRDGEPIEVEGTFFPVKNAQGDRSFGVAILRARGRSVDVRDAASSPASRGPATQRRT